MLLGASPREGWVVGVWRRESLALRECAFYHRKWRSLGEPDFLSFYAEPSSAPLIPTMDLSE